MPNQPRDRRSSRPEPSDSGLQADPIVRLRQWLDEAAAAGLDEPGAAALATATPEARPSARMVVLRAIGPDGVVFHTHYQSRKARELEANPWAALVCYWRELDRQVRIEGPVERLAAAESDAYFRTRPVQSRLSAWASPQSQVIPDRAFLERRVQELVARYRHGSIPRPPFWGGYRLEVERIEFWQARAHRLHDRALYTRNADGAWRVERLAP